MNYNNVCINLFLVDTNILVIVIYSFFNIYTTLKLFWFYNFFFVYLFLLCFILCEKVFFKKKNPSNISKVPFHSNVRSLPYRRSIYRNTLVAISFLTSHNLLY